MSENDATTAGTTDPATGAVTPVTGAGATPGSTSGPQSKEVQAIRSPRDFFDMVQANWPFGPGGWTWRDWRDTWPWREGDAPTGYPIRVEETTEGDTRVIRAELPGVDPEKDVSITVEDGYLTIRAQRTERTENRESGSYRSEFRYGSFHRQVRLPRNARAEAVTASYRDGVLEVRLPATGEEGRGHSIPVTRG
jgi:HSP20 family protein